MNLSLKSLKENRVMSKSYKKGIVQVILEDSGVISFTYTLEGLRKAAGEVETVTELTKKYDARGWEPVKAEEVKVEEVKEEELITPQSELQEELELIEEIKEDKKLLQEASKVELTTREKLILNAMRTNEYSDLLESDSEWTFTVIDNSGLTEKVARGVLSSLVKKGLIEVSQDLPLTSKNGGDISHINFTQLGKALFINSDGEENKGWGGARLLKVTEKELKALKKEKKEAPTKKEAKIQKEDSPSSPVVKLAEIIEELRSKNLIEDSTTPKKIRRLLRGHVALGGIDEISKGEKFRWEWPSEQKEEIKKSILEMLR